MKIKIQFLLESHISEEYIHSLNSKNYMKFSRNSSKNHTIELQKKYLTKFDFTSSFILALHEESSNKLIGTSTFYVNEFTHVINIGLLIFEEYSGRGFGSLAMKEVVEFVESIFPNYELEIGTDMNHKAMINIAISNKFELEYQNNNQVFFRKKNPFARILKVLSKNEITIICNDVGGATNIASLMKILNISPKGIVTGPAILVFNKLNVLYTEVDFESDYFANGLIILGSSIYGGLESLVLEDPKFRNTTKVVILDHWMNYRERFHKNNNFLPDEFWVTNDYSHQLASQFFPETSVVTIPDAQLALVKRSLLRLNGAKDTLLLIWEYQTLSAESLKFPVGLLGQRLKQIEKYCVEKLIPKITVRLHPSQNKKEFEDDLSSMQIAIPIEISSLEHLEQDLDRAIVVIGFSSSALYISSKLGIPTYSFFKEFRNHWTNSFSEIEQFVV